MSEKDAPEDNAYDENDPLGARLNPIVNIIRGTYKNR